MPIVFTGRVFSVEIEKVQGPKGKEHQVETVRHRPSVVLLPMKDAGHVVLIRQYRHSVRRELWELPAGGIEPGESADAAAARECEEEIGLRPERVEKLRELFPAPGFCDEVLVFFRVSDLRPPAPDSPHQPDEDEDIHSQVFTIAEAQAMVARGDIVDLKTAFALSLI
jgi:8-oxo-dGTP pyrophosphatase MutT (NUDIX family)